MSSTDSGDGESRDTGEDSSDVVDPAQPPLFDLMGDPAEYGVDDAGNPLDVGSGFGDLWAMDGDDIPDSDPIADNPQAASVQRARRLFARRTESRSSDLSEELADDEPKLQDEPESATELEPAVPDTAMPAAGDSDVLGVIPRVDPAQPSSGESRSPTGEAVDDWLAVTDQVDHEAAASDTTVSKRRRFGWLRAQPAPHDEAVAIGEESAEAAVPATESPSEEKPVESSSGTTPGSADMGEPLAPVVASVADSPDELTRIPLVRPPDSLKDPQSESTAPGQVPPTEDSPPVPGFGSSEQATSPLPDQIAAVHEISAHTGGPVQPSQPGVQQNLRDGDVFDIDGETPTDDLDDDASGTAGVIAEADAESAEDEGLRVSSTLSVVPPVPTLSAVPDAPEDSTPYSVDSFDDFAFDFEDLMTQETLDEPELDPSGSPLAQWPGDGSASTSEDSGPAVAGATSSQEPPTQRADDTTFDPATGETETGAEDMGRTDARVESRSNGLHVPNNVVPEAAEPVGDEDGDEEYEHVEVKPGAPVDVAAYTSEEYVQESTAEHAGLARAIAEADERGSEHAALYAALPGMEDEVVGLEDVVDMTMEQESVSLAKPAPPSDIATRVGTSVGLVAVVALALLNPVTTGILAFFAFGIAALEYYTALQRAGARPVTWAGLLGIAGAFVGTWVFGLVAIPVSVVLSTIAAALFLSFKPTWPRPGVNLAFTMLCVAWIGGSGGLIFSILRSPDYRVLVAVLILMVVVLDVAQYFTGRAFGKRPLTPVVSPKKTVEGLIGGYVALVAAGLVLSRFAFWDQSTAMVLVVSIGIVAPLGDLSVSVIKRSLRMKDMGVVLPGHGGVLDRIDALLFAIPAAWVVFTWAGLM